ncbi:hypothetical protein LCGC14_2950380, partial [marine sediment metagenome]
TQVALVSYHNLVMSNPWLHFYSCYKPSVAQRVRLYQSEPRRSTLVNDLLDH